MEEDDSIIIKNKEEEETIVDDENTNILDNYKNLDKNLDKKKLKTLDFDEKTQLSEAKTDLEKRKKIIVEYKFNTSEGKRKEMI